MDDAKHPLDRRGFLRGVTGGAAALALAPRLPAGSTQDYPQAAADGVRLRSLTPKEYAVARAAAEALLAHLPVEPAGAARYLDRELALMGEPIASDMKAVLALLEHLTFLGGRVRRFTALPADARLAYLQGWGTSRFNLRRAAFHAIRTLVYFWGYAEPDAWRATGFQGTWPQRGVPVPPYDVDFGGIA